ncbi:unnamed protein product [Ectocarpus sp. 13 AM-2016]
MVGIAAGRSLEGQSAARLAMTWKDRQRTRVPLVDLDDNPFCVERRTNEEWHMMQLNKNPSLVHLTSADVPRTASFMVDTKKPFRKFSRKKRNLLAWSLRAASASDAAGQATANKTHMATRRLSTTVPSDLGGTDIGELFNMEQGVSGRVLHPTDRVEVDVDTLPTLEPYRREVVVQQPITFGHRPLSASRMFNPCTMATSYGIPSDGHQPSTGGIRGRMKGGCGHRGGSSRKRGRNSKPRRTTGLSAPMLKALLRGDTPTGEGGAALVTASQQQQEPFEPNENIVSRDSDPKPNYLELDGQEDLTDSSGNSEKLDESKWRSADDLGRGGALGELGSWLQTSSQEGLGHGRRRLGNTKEGQELHRIFSSERPPWDGAPAPLPAPQHTRRAISSLLMPDPDERLRDKLIKSRKAAAGVPVTASSTKDEREQELRHFNPTPTGRWEVCPATPRAVIARQQIRRLSELREERDSAMAKKVRQAELSVLFKKIAPSEKHYRNTLRIAQERFRHQGTAAI